MTASAILSAPAPLTGAANPPPAEAGTVLPAAAAAFAALVDATAAPSAQPSAATPRIDPSVTPATAPGAIAPAGIEPVGMPVTNELLPAPTPEVAGGQPPLPPASGAEGQPAAPVAGKPSVHADESVPDVEAKPVEPGQPVIVQPQPPAQHQPAVIAGTPTEPVPPLKDETADPAASEGEGGEVAAQLATTALQTPVPSTGAAQPAAQAVPAASAKVEADASEAVPEVRRTKAVEQAHAAANTPMSGGKEMPAADAARPVAQSAAVATTDVPATADQPDTGLPSPLLTQTMAPVTGRPAAMPYPAVAPASPQAPVVAAQPGRMGADIGVEIAKAANGDREDLLIRLDPRDMGRINVRLSFDSDGVLRAVMSADSPAALDMLRRESGDLNRALADAGIRSDAQSLRFDARSSDQGQGGNQSGQRGQQGSQGSTGDGSADLADVQYRPLRSSGQVDLMA
ncbi:flagellar hook-length control protein FliK [Sphingomonas koreensis]|jgi:flagellar hook-length control protein FliK|uniref:flagellar hook-length control protein FliK n=1 Tax=Sphingomonas koreensis TaxID=93064 RepID=UPI0009FB0E54|nr:flagellar hook-length control protein FliK [Sphingomonas koreensis]MDC7812572.1 flagellar hook-length control protein FliK [Sphingomonas koreensis]